MKLKRCRLTAAGAKHIGRPELTNEIVYYSYVIPNTNAVNQLMHNDYRLFVNTPVKIDGNLVLIDG